MTREVVEEHRSSTADAESEGSPAPRSDPERRRGNASNRCVDIREAFFAIYHALSRIQRRMCDVCIRRSLVVSTALLASSLAAQAAGFTLSSPTIKPGSMLSEAQVFNGFGCSGKNISPALSWKDAPAGTKSFAVTLYDPDAPSGSGWWHWVVFNIPATTMQLPEGAGSADGKNMPAGSVQGRTDFGASAFGGACPPAGDKPHRYVFTVYALKTDKLDVPADATAALIGSTVQANKLGEAKLTARYGRSK
jgi:Raf kinase inhibitor-like YbhB/YbcL family protein